MAIKTEERERGEREREGIVPKEERLGISVARLFLVFVLFSCRPTNSIVLKGSTYSYLVFTLEIPLARFKK